MIRSSLAAVSLAILVQGDCVVKDAQCYVDDSDRILGDKNLNTYDGLSNEFCAQLCLDLKMPLAGTEDGHECYCGADVRSSAQTAPTSECNTKCAGYANETCGGRWRVSVFKVDCSGPPVPPPPEAAKLVNPCLNTSQPFHAMPFCDPTLAIDDRVADAVSRMTIAEKISALGTGTGAIASLGIPAYNWWSEATHGISHIRIDETTPFVTNFAFPITTAMSFNRTLWRLTGRQIGREARALMNVGNAYSTFWAPVINLAREPRWGRNLECPGEDPYQVGEYASEFVQGFERAPEDAGHLQASACCKHYVANSMESSTEVGVHHWRNEYNAIVPMQDLVDSYMLPFQACVEKGKVSGLMCSYNAVNGVPSCANDWLLDDVARGEWGFDGYVTSDCDADADVFNHHNWTETPEETVAAVLRAGTDVDCGGFVSTHAQSALDKKVITEEDVNKRLQILFKVRMRLSHFDPLGPLNKIPASSVCSEYAVALARDGAAQSCALLKNEGNTLPLSASMQTKVGVIGPNSQLASSMASYYGERHVCNNDMWNMLTALGERVTTQFEQGCADVKTDDTSGIAAAVSLASSADVVVLVVGTDLSWAAEGRDATSISFSKCQAQLIQQVAAAASVPVIVVTLTATPLDLTAVLANKKVGAVLHAGQPSVTTQGVVDIMFGDKVPAGRLVQTILPASYATDISIFDMRMRPGPSPFPRPDCTLPIDQCPNGTNPGRTYRFYTGKEVLPFGYGLSYSNFTYKVVAAPPAVSLSALRSVLTASSAAGRTFPPTQHLDAIQDVAFVVNVTNTGAMDADDAVLGFIVPPDAGVGGVPLKSLFGFKRVHVKKGQTVTVNLYPDMLFFSQAGLDGQRVALAGSYTVQFGLPHTAEKGQGFAAHAFTAV